MFVQPLVIAPTEETPYVCFNHITNVFEIKGKFVLPNVDEFYTPLFEWLDNAPFHKLEVINLIFNLDYFNIASSKRLLFILYRLNQMHKDGKKIIVTWCYRIEDDDMKEVGEDFAFMVNLPFNFVGYNLNEEPITTIPDSILA